MKNSSPAQFQFPIFLFLAFIYSVVFISLTKMEETFIASESMLITKAGKVICQGTGVVGEVDVTK